MELVNFLTSLFSLVGAIVTLGGALGAYVFTHLRKNRLHHPHLTSVAPVDLDVTGGPRQPSVGTLPASSLGAAIGNDRRDDSRPPTRIVDSMHRGDHATIAEAIEASRPGDRIIVRPGLYVEGLTLDKPLEIVGEGEPGEVTIEARNQPVILFRTTTGSVANVTVRQMRTVNETQWAAVAIIQGRIDVVGCDITSQSGPGVAIVGGADPRLRGNNIHHNKGAGVTVTAASRGLLEDNQIAENDEAGVVITAQSYPLLRRNRIHGCGHAGVRVLEGSEASLEDNEIYDNALAGVAIASGARPTLRRNRINRNEHEGIWVYESGAGTFEDNDLRENRKGGWDIAPESKERVERVRNRE